MHHSRSWQIQNKYRCSSLDGVTACVVYTADLIRKFDSKSNRTAYSIRDSIRTQKNDSQVPSWNRTLEIAFYREIGLQICQLCLQLKTFGALWLQLFMPAHSHRQWWHPNVVFGNLGEQFLSLLFKISSVRCLTHWRQSSETKETLFCINIKPMHCLQVTLLSHYCAIFGCCNVTEYCNCCQAAICKHFPQIILLIIAIEWYKSCRFMKFTT